MGYVIITDYIIVYNRYLNRGSGGSVVVAAAAAQCTVII